MAASSSRPAVSTFRAGQYAEDLVSDTWTSILTHPGDRKLDEKRAALQRTWRTDIDQKTALVYYKTQEQEPKEYKENERFRDALLALIRQRDWSRKFPYSVALTQAAWLFYHMTRTLKVKEEVAEDCATKVMKLYKSRRKEAWKFVFQARNEVVTSIRLLFEFLQWPKPCSDPPAALVAETVDEKEEETVETDVSKKRQKKSEQKVEAKRTKR